MLLTSPRYEGAFGPDLVVADVKSAISRLPEECVLPHQAAPLRVREDGAILFDTEVDRNWGARLYLTMMGRREPTSGTTAVPRAACRPVRRSNLTESQGTSRALRAATSGGTPYLTAGEAFEPSIAHCESPGPPGLSAFSGARRGSNVVTSSFEPRS